MLNGGYRRFNSGSVDQLDASPSQPELPDQVIACAAPCLADHRSVGSEQGVEQRTFAGVPAAHKHHATWSLPDPPGLDLLFESIQLSSGLFQCVLQLAGANEFQVLLRKIQPGLKIGQQVQQAVQQPSHRPCDTTCKLVACHGCLLRCFGINQSPNGFGSGQIHLAV